MNQKIVSSIKSVLMAALSILAIIGLGKYVPLIELVLANFDGVVQAITTVISFVGLILAWRPTTDEQTAGSELKKDFKGSLQAQSSSDKRQAFFDYVKKKK